MLNRRNFLRNTALSAVGSLLIPSFLKAFERQTANSLAENDKILVIIQLSGGNDGLNTVVPFTNDLYYKARPSLAIEPAKVLKLNDDLGFNPAMAKMKMLYDEGLVSVINNVGYPNPDRSHFRSMDIWHTASNADEYLSTGWLGRYLDAQCSGGECQSYTAIELDDSLSLAMKGNKIKAMALQNPQKLYESTQIPFIKSLTKNTTDATHHSAEENVSYLYKTLAETASSAEYIYNKSKIQRTKSEYKGGELANRLKTVAELIISGVPTRVYYVALSGFDTHIRQAEKQEKLLENYSEAVYSFVQDMKANGLIDKVLLMTFSEFGRRVAQNGSNGTDHGTANNLFLIGNNLPKKGIYNKPPNLADLDNGDLKYEIDFRNVYATLLNKWLNVNDSGILGQKFEGLPIL